MEEIMPFVIILILGIGVLLYTRWKKRTGYEGSLWSLIIRGVAVIALSVMLLLNENNLGPVGRIIAILFCSTIAVLVTIQIFKKVKA